MAIVVTGGAGFIGSCFVWKLNQEGIDDIIIVDSLGEDEKWKNLVGKKYEDYMDKSLFFDLLMAGKLDNKIDRIVHMGACSATTETDASYLMQNNYGYSKRLAKWAIRHSARFVYASSAATYGSGENGYSDSREVSCKLRPLNMYGYSKQAFDEWVLKNNLDISFAGFKFFNVYGPNEYHKDDMRSMVHKGYEQIKATGKIKLFKSYNSEYADGEQKRDFVYVKDVVSVMYNVFADHDKGGIFNLGSASAHSWNELATAIFKALNIEPSIEYIEMPDTLKGKYQYFTKADMAKINESGCSVEFTEFEAAIKDYVNILETDKYL